MNERDEIKYVTLDDAIAINRATVEAHGGTFGIRDAGLLESALAQPQQHVFGEDLHPSIEDKAAAYMYYLSQNHPFHDGNKRTALAVMGRFVESNGYDLNLTNEQAERITLGVAAGERSKEELTKTLAQHIEPGRERAEQARQQRENVFGDAPDADREAERIERDFERSR